MRGASSDLASSPFETSLQSDHRRGGSSGIPGCYEKLDQRPEQRLAPPPDVVHEFEEPEVQRQPLLRDPSMGSEPAPQERPGPLERVDVDLAESVAVIIPGVLALGM